MKVIKIKISFNIYFFLFCLNIIKKIMFGFSALKNRFSLYYLEEGELYV